MLLSLCMIVKDEAATIARTLRSVRPFIDRWILVDTGSTDDTAGEVRRALEGVPGELSEAPFVDFSTTRNLALDRCGEATEFILWLDADDELQGGAALRAFLERERLKGGADREAYYVRVDTGVRFDSARVLRAKARWRFEGVVHEVLTRQGRPPPVHRVPDVLVVHRSEGASAERSRARWARDVGLLGTALEADPHNARAAFYLAETLRWLGRHAEAEAAYARRIALGGWHEEVFRARMGLAEVMQAQGRPWRDVLDQYLAAHAAAPRRAEPLFAIAYHYNAEGEHALCLLFARRGYEMPLPTEEHLFVDEDVYRWKLADLVGASAFWVGEYALGEEALRKALRYRPEDARLRSNLEFYLQRKQKGRPKKGR